MLRAVAALALVLAVSSPAIGEPTSYADAVAADAAVSETPDAIEGSEDVLKTLNPEQAALMAEDADWSVRATLYHAGGGGATGDDSLGCRPVAMRTVAVDPKVIPRHTRLFIRETVGMRMPDGSRHDGYWYASDTGGAIKGRRIDLYTGYGRGSMRPAMRFNRGALTVVNAGHFDGCPPSWEATPNANLMMASLGDANGER